MKAAVLRRFGATFGIEDLPVPIPRPGEALIRVRAVGLCGSDIEILSGRVRGVDLPAILGHEVAGELAEPAGSLPAGSPVSVHPMVSCGSCSLCRAGDTTVCPSLQRIGFERDGGLAQYMVAPISNLIPFTVGIRFDQAAVAMDAVQTPWRAIRTRAGVTAGDKVAIIGVGGLGLHAVQIAKAIGAQVAVVDPLVGHRDAAIGLGADIAVAPEEFEHILSWAPGGVDIAIETSGRSAGFRSASSVIRPAGTVVCVGYQPGGDFAAESYHLVTSELTILGSRGGTINDGREALAAVEVGRVNPLIGGRGTLSEVNELIQRLRSGDAVGRLVVEL